uniref:Prostaglandin G/H synthase 1 n=1 Tax=Leptobrachium leishanense TaxID=445787 RepID=A0A8C5MQC6_9ANUR
MTGFTGYVALFLIMNISYSLETANTVNPCCYFPCQHKGVCVRFELTKYECDCTRTGYYGVNCTIPVLWTRVYEFLRPSPGFAHYILTRFKWFWDLINATFIRDTIVRLVLTGKPQLPDARLLTETFLKREKFIPDPQGTNLLFAFFAQHFTHQFFKTYGKMGRGFTKGLGHGVDLSHVYGDNLERQHMLRLFIDGKLKYQIINGSMYPPTVAQAPVYMIYPDNVPKEKQYAMGQEVFGLLPGLMMFATIWLREHNRVCDILKKEHPTWDDEQLFQTTRLILIGETIKIVIEDYVQHLSGYYLKLKFDPELLFGVQFQYRNRIAVEFNQLYHWHPLMPDTFHIMEDEYDYSNFVYNTSILTSYGVSALVGSFTRQAAGKIGGGKNTHPKLLNVAVGIIEESRKLRLQPFNEYRKRFNLKAYKSFKDLTGEEIVSKQLESLYGDIEALEFYPGLLLEKTHPNSIFGESMIEIGAPFSLKGLMGNPICSPEYWKPSTFGGETGFNIVKTASIEKLVCLNVKQCPFVAFHVPDLQNEDTRAPNTKQSEEL